MATNHLLDFRCNFIHITARKLPHHPLLTRNSHQLLRLTWIFRIFIFSQLYLAVWCYRCQLSRPVNVTMHLKLQNLKPNVPVDSMGIFVFLRLSLSLWMSESVYVTGSRAFSVGVTSVQCAYVKPVWVEDNSWPFIWLPNTFINIDVFGTFNKSY